ncbi:hypothetical protein CH63R_05165 [Colletotrichum higginsianum IMI 349063]|uniref:Uncharacterized protein n=1 Tax=Colletotrichum higginsianum (strain IMI 349063) TaxID=759273 RepID=A0A1B7YLF8_COLHI|nr:hypothetical protein CH63R_05165 [Colletotrichum higginsianum IMI 349063]OBR12869.1 hypothetical protein CH63R_05165 [Colletotrichum higginsianum IMI 349063]
MSAFREPPFLSGVIYTTGGTLPYCLYAAFWETRRLLGGPLLHLSPVIGGALSNLYMPISSLRATYTALAECYPEIDVHRNEYQLYFIDRVRGPNDHRRALRFGPDWPFVCNSRLRPRRAHRVLQRFTPRQHRVANHVMPAVRRAWAHPQWETRTERSGDFHHPHTLKVLSLS